MFWFIRNYCHTLMEQLATFFVVKDHWVDRDLLWTPISRLYLLLTSATIVLCNVHLYDNVMDRQVIFQIPQLSILTNAFFVFLLSYLYLLLTSATIALCNVHLYDNVMGRQVIFQIPQLSILIFYSADVETKLSNCFLKKLPQMHFLSSCSHFLLRNTISLLNFKLSSMHCTLSYCLTKISLRAKRSISRVFSLFIVPSPFFCTLPVQRPY